MNRLEALMSGNPRYDTDKPCKYGHVAQRYARNGGCVTCVHLSAKKCNNNYLTVGEEINSKTKLIYLFARENDFPAIKMSLDCFLALKFPEVNPDYINRYPFKIKKRESEDIVKIRVRVPIEYANNMYEIGKQFLQPASPIAAPTPKENLRKWAHKL